MKAIVTHVESVTEHPGAMAVIVEGGALEIREMKLGVEFGDYRVAMGYSADTWILFHNEQGGPDD